MKWIGQHIWDFISRFRNDVYLEDIDTGTIASGGNLGLDSDNKIVKATTGTATVATTVTVTDNENAAEYNLLTFVADAATATGNHGLEMDGNCTYHPLTGTVTANIFDGTLAGNIAKSTGFTPTLSVVTDCAIDPLVAGTEYVVNDADGGAMVLPAVVKGARIKIIIGTTITSNTITITAQSGDLLKGYAILKRVAVPFTYAASFVDDGDDLIFTMDGGLKGGFIGDKIELIGISDTEWRVRGDLAYTGGTALNPFS
jgi:hypothetical protein